MTIDRITCMGRRSFVPTGALAILAVLAGTWTEPTFAQSATSVRFPAGSIRSIPEADAALAETAKERAAIEARYLSEEQACHPRFFANSCIEQAKERRRTALSALRPVEIAANTFKRQSRVTERDNELAERLAKDEKERQERVSSLPAARSPVTETPESSLRNVQTSISAEDERKHEVTMNQVRADDTANAKKRAEKIAAYEKKKQDALVRQQKVAERKAEKAKKRQAKQLEGSKPQ